jgi:hypothetical protein
MSWATCYSACNNIHYSKPPLMSDGRNFTNWTPACDINTQLVKSTGITNNHEYRQHLINNADRLIAGNQLNACEHVSGNNSIYGRTTFTNGIKHLYRSVTDDHAPYGYEHSDLKSMYLTRTALSDRMRAPILNQEQLLRMPKHQ